MNLFISAFFGILAIGLLADAFRYSRLIHRAIDRRDIHGQRVAANGFNADLIALVVLVFLLIAFYFLVGRTL